ncbi:MAG: substrate-binding domain-containing protein [Acidobacteriia bacterium]|nr:substrate-binding domain-containing protein [Terriglobia bacterium]
MKRIGIYRIAELAKVSIGTVDRALHGRPGIREATRKKVLRIANRLAYSPNPAARALSVGRATLRIGICIPREIRLYYDQMRAGILDESGRASGLGVELVQKPVPSLGVDEKKQMTALLNSGVKGIITTPGNPEIIGPLIDQAEEDNIRVVCTTTDAPHSRRSSIVAVDPELSGRLAAELMAKFVPPASKAAVVTGMLSTEEHRLKTAGFSSGFTSDCAGGEVVAVLEAHESEEESYRKTCELLERKPGLRGIYVSTVNCLPVCRALKKYGLAGIVTLITTDLFPQMVPHLQQGTILASIYQNPYLQGQVAMRILLDHFVNRTPIPASSYIGPALVLRSNVHLFREVQETVSPQPLAQAL